MVEMKLTVITINIISKYQKHVDPINIISKYQKHVDSKQLQVKGYFFKKRQEILSNTNRSYTSKNSWHKTI